MGLSVLVSFSIQDAFATTYTLDGRIACESAPFNGAWGSTASECSVLDVTISSTNDVIINSPVRLAVLQGGNLTINNGATVTNNAGIVIYGHLINDGTLVNAEASTFNISTAGPKGNLTNNGSIKNDGAFTNGGTLDNTGTITNGNGGVLTNTGTLSNSGTLTNEGTIDNNLGTISNSGIINNSGAISNLGTINNSGTIDNSGVIDLSTNGNGSTINNLPGGTLSNSGTININHAGLIDNKLGAEVNNTGDLIIYVGGFIKNAGTITNSGDINNANGEITNDGTIINVLGEGTITNGGTIFNNEIINNFSQFTNTGTIVNKGFINNHSNLTNSRGTVTNSGKISNFAGATIRNSGVINNAAMINNYCGGVLTGTVPKGEAVNNILCSSISIDDATVTEGNSGINLVFTVTRTGDLTGTFNVNYVTEGGTATEDVDYDRTSGTLTFMAGESYRLITVAVTGDTDLEPTEKLNVNLQSCVVCTISDGTGVGTIVDDDTPIISIGDVSINEGNAGDTNFDFKVTRTGGLGSFSVNFETQGNAATATAGTDYQAVSAGTVTFGANASEQTIRILVKGDSTPEPKEYFGVALTSCATCTILDGLGVGWIVDDDTLPRVSISDPSPVLEGNSGTKSIFFAVSRSDTSGNPSVNYKTEDGTADGNDYQPAGGVVNFPNGITKVNVEMFLTGDTAKEKNEQFNVNLSNCVGCTILDGTGVGTIEDDDFPSITINDVAMDEGDKGLINFVFTLTNTGNLTEESSVNWATQDGSAKAVSDYVQLSGIAKFKPTTRTTTQTMTVAIPVVADEVAELPPETFNVILSNCIGCIIKDGTGVGTINDDDTPKVYINDVTKVEGDSGITDFVFKLTRSGIRNASPTVNYVTQSGTAFSGSDFQQASGTVSVLGKASNTSNTITIHVSGDSEVEPNEGFSVNLSGCSGCIIADPVGLGTIKDDDFSGISIKDAGIWEGNSGQKDLNFTVTRTGYTDGIAALPWNTNDGTTDRSNDYVQKSGIINFAKGETAKTIAILVNGDTRLESHETFNVELGPGCTGCTLVDAKGVGTILDDDSPRISILDLSMREGTRTTRSSTGVTEFDFVIERSNLAGAPLMCVHTNDGRAPSALGSYLTTVAADYYPRGDCPQQSPFNSNSLTATIPVYVLKDSVPENPETFFVWLDSCKGCMFYDNGAVGTIINDD